MCGWLGERDGCRKGGGGNTNRDEPARIDEVVDKGSSVKCMYASIRTSMASDKPYAKLSYKKNKMKEGSVREWYSDNSNTLMFMNEEHS